jgi:hypothetical protein
MVNNLSHLKTRKHLLGILTAGTLLGLLTSMPATAAIFTTTATVIGHAPILTGEGLVMVSDKNGNKIPDVGDVLTVDETKFTFSDVDGDTSTGTTYEWFSGASSLGTGTTYTIKTVDLGKTIKLRATAHTDTTTTDPAVATAAVESKFSNIDGTKTDELVVVGTADVISVTMTNGDRPEVNKVLTAMPVCAGGACTPANLEYVWSIESTAGTYTTIPNATTATYTPRKEDQKKRIKVAVNTKNAVHPVSRR